ncbi:MAG: amidohydrolase [Candidatus Aminicenantes bacterium RBG_19FT_COMBO_58_17]|nr:MAG: amidohydrolase [Candidatus Aminicenantes bacterium RBG_19FT_COMBO_58_17]
MKIRTWIFFVFLAATSFLPACIKVRAMADLALLGGSLWTGDDARPWAEAVAVRGEKIVAVGTSKDIRRLVGPGTRVIDLAGALVVPGFIDSHTHFLDGGFALLSIRLREAKSRDEFVAVIRDKAVELAKGEWILNGDWDQQQFDPPELPRRDWIDAATPENPVCVNRHDGHMVLANSLALMRAGITARTPSPAGGEILRDSRTGEPTGILKDAAMELVTRHIPEPTAEARLKTAEAALRLAAENGITSTHDMAYGTGNFTVYRQLIDAGKLTCRVFLYVPIPNVDAFSRLSLKTPFGNDFLKIGGLKGFVDGSLGSSTALFFEPYTDDPKGLGLFHPDMIPEGIMEQRIRAADAAGLQVAVHAIGDRANAVLLDIFEKVITQNGPRDRRWRIEHVQHLRPEDMERMARLRIIASVQPYHAIDDGRWAEQKIGPERCRTTYAFRSLLDKGVRLAAGSDWTVAPLDPLAGIYAAVTRRTTDGKHPGGWYPEQKISLEQALRAYTTDGAYAEFAELSKGTIKEGFLADLVVLNRNIFRIPAEEIAEARVQTTVVGGRIVFPN